MTYLNPVRREIVSSDTLSRKVLLALEVFDPLSQTLVSSGLSVAAAGLGQPLVNLSGRFVWLDQGNDWPNQITVDPVDLPFLREAVQPPQPPGLPNVTTNLRRVRIVLRPTAAADFSDVTAIRGQLFETAIAPSAAVTDATIQLAWFDATSSAWVPSPERSGPTSRTGEFAAFLRLQPTIMQEPDLMGGLLKVRVQATRAGATRATPDDYQFLLAPQPSGRIVDGELLARDLRLGWSELKAV